MIFLEDSDFSKLQHLNAVSNQLCLKKELSKYLISDFPQPLVFMQYSHFKKTFSLLTLFLNLHTSVHPSNNLFQRHE